MVIPVKNDSEPTHMLFPIFSPVTNEIIGELVVPKDTGKRLISLLEDYLCFLKPQSGPQDEVGFTIRAIPIDSMSRVELKGKQ